MLQNGEGTEMQGTGVGGLDSPIPHAQLLKSF